MTAPYDDYEDGTLFPGYGEPVDIDPDTLLEQIRRRVNEYMDDDGLTDAGVEDLVRTIDLLDGWLGEGGPFPEAWTRPGSTGRRIEDVQVRRRGGQSPLLSGTR